MTEAGRTREKPTAHGWYFYKDKDGFIDVVAVRRVDSYGGPNLHEVVITVEKTTAVYQKNLHSKVSDLDGEWLGPLSPDSYQQGRVAGLREAAGAICMYCNDPRNWAPMSNSGYHVCNTPGPNHVRCQATLIHELLAQQAKDEKGVGDGKV